MCSINDTTNSKIYSESDIFHLIRSISSSYISDETKNLFNLVGSGINIVEYYRDNKAAIDLYHYNMELNDNVTDFVVTNYSSSTSNINTSYKNRCKIFGDFVVDNISSFQSYASSFM